MKRIYSPFSTLNSTLPEFIMRLPWGQGKINLSGALQIMKDFRYQGWLILELERTLAGRSPKESAQISKQYLTDRLRLTL